MFPAERILLTVLHILVLVTDYVLKINDDDDDDDFDGIVMTISNLQLLLAAIGCVLFEERIGCFNDPPPVKAREFIDNIVGVFKYQQPLMYKPPIYKIFPTKDWRVFEGYADRVTDCARQFVNKVIVTTQLSPVITFILADRTATHYDRLLASSCRPSVRPTVRPSVEL